MALVNDKRREQFEQTWKQIAPELDFILVNDTAKTVITACDMAMLASGTVALECMLLKRPMVVGYRVNPFTAYIAKKLVKTDCFSAEYFGRQRAGQRASFRGLHAKKFSQ